MINHSRAGWKWEENKETAGTSRSKKRSKPPTLEKKLRAPVSGGDQNVAAASSPPPRLLTESMHKGASAICGRWTSARAGDASTCATRPVASFSIDLAPENWLGIRWSHQKCRCTGSKCKHGSEIPSLTDRQQLFEGVVKVKPACTHVNRDWLMCLNLWENSF